MDPQSKLNQIAQGYEAGPMQQALARNVRKSFGTPEPEAPAPKQLYDNTGGVPFNQNPEDQAMLAKKKAAFEAAMAARGLVPGQE